MMLQGRPSVYIKGGALECLPCAQGCEWCEDARPCVAALNWPVRTALLALSAAVICCLPAVALFTVKYGHVKVGIRFSVRIPSKAFCSSISSLKKTCAQLVLDP